MPTTEDLNRARAAYTATRQIWFADGLLDAYERLALVTVAAGVRQFAFLSHASPKDRKLLSGRITGIGMQTCFLGTRFDLDVHLPDISAPTIETYKKFKRRNERGWGLGVSLPNRHPSAISLTDLGLKLSYPECCVRMDVETKRRDHELFLGALVKEVGDNAEQVWWALRRRVAVEKPSHSHLQKWHRRYERTSVRFPFVLHAACDNCLKAESSPTAALNTSYEILARDVSEELHFLIRWAAHTITRGRAQ